MYKLRLYASFTKRRIPSRWLFLYINFDNDTCRCIPDTIDHIVLNISCLLVLIYYLINCAMVCTSFIDCYEGGGLCLFFVLLYCTYCPINVCNDLVAE